MNSIAEAMSTTMDNSNMVTTAADEMTSTINEIAQNSEKARDITITAVAQASTASDKMALLG